MLSPLVFSNGDHLDLEIVTIKDPKRVKRRTLTMFPVIRGKLKTFVFQCLLTQYGSSPLSCASFPKPMADNLPVELEFGYDTPLLIQQIWLSVHLEAGV